MKNKRFLAIFLVLTMLVSLMPVGFAADEAEEEPVIVEEELAEEVVEEVEEPELTQLPPEITEEEEETELVESSVSGQAEVTFTYGYSVTNKNAPENKTLYLDNGILSASDHLHRR